MSAKFPIWQYILLLIVTIFSFIYAIPNFYGEDPSVQISLKQSIANNNYLENLEKPNLEFNTDLLVKEINHKLKVKQIKFKAIKRKNDNIIIHFFDPRSELLAKELLEDWLGEKYNVTLNLATLVPSWLSFLGAKPMKLGLDLRGGVRFLIEVDISSVINSDNYKDQHQELQNHKLKINNQVSDLKNSIMERTIVTIRNRVNELGVSESVVQRHGSNNIVVELPGVQDTARAKDILGKTATLHFVMLDDTGIHGPLNRSLKYRDGRKILVKKKVVLTGDSIIWANSGVDPKEGKPMVALRLVHDHKLNNFKKFTGENIGKSMAIIYRENKAIQKPNKNLSKSFIVEETVISVATIQSELGDNFQITGLNLAESRDLALLLRSGAMPAQVSVVEERIIGPSLGQENIKMGIISVCLGLTLVLIVMTGYYSLFGLIANLTLLLNLILLMAGMSIIEATLTLPGIAGIVLTLGMAVDANVLIFERIREELNTGASALLSIHRGFNYALSTIVDSNLTTLIVGVILFFVGSGPVKGFAVVLSIGILTSLFTAIIGTKAIVSLLYERKMHLKKVWIGI